MNSWEHANVINIDKQRVAAVRKLEALGYSFDGAKWMPPSPSAAAGREHS
jgi:hypothetical protein